MKLVFISKIKIATFLKDRAKSNSFYLYLISISVITLISPLLVDKQILVPRTLSLLLALLLAPLLKSTLYLSVALLISFGIYGLVGITHGYPNILMLSSLLETNGGEIYGFVINIPILNWMLSALFILCTLMYLVSARHYYRKRRLVPGAAIVLCFLVLILTSYEGRSVNMLYKKVGEYFDHKALLQLSLNSKDSWDITTNKNHARYKNYVVIIGESARKDYMGLYGYKHDTTPFLAKSNGVFFNDVYSPAASTIASLTKSLQQIKPDSYEVIPQNNIVTLANKAGYKTIWVSNSNPIGKHDSAVSVIAKKAEKAYFSKNSFFDPQVKDDFKLLDVIESELEQKEARSRVFILQTMGSHPPVCKTLNNFPVDFNLNVDSEVNCYLASIKKTDMLIQKAVEMLKAAGSYSLIYFSDHGISVKRDGVRHKFDVFNNYQVPLVVLSSDADQQYRHNKTFSLIDFIPLFSQWLGIGTKGLSDQFNIFDSVNIPESRATPIFYRDGNALNIDQLKKEEII